MNDIIISTKDLAIGYNNKILSENININIKQKEIISIIGPNGSGKTTLLKTLLGIIPPISGSIFINGIKNPKPEQISKIIGIVPQVYNYDKDFPLKTFSVILMGFYPSLSFYNRINRSMKNKALDYAKRFGVCDLLDKPIGILSEGQKQKISLIRALVSSPEVLLLDEPFSSIDLKSVEEISCILKEISKKGITIIMVNHNIFSIVGFVNRLLCLGRNTFIHGTPAEVLDSETLECIFGKDHLFVHHNDIPHIVLKKH